jgi:hypothetical protein
LGFYDLARELQRLSFRLILEHPLPYLRNVVEGWINFWKAPVYWRADGLQLEGLQPVFRVWVLAGRGLTVLINFAFLGLSGLFLVSKRFRERFGFDLYALAMGGLIWATSMLQSLPEHGDNHRFLVPLQMLLITLVITSGWTYFRSRRGSSG